MKYFQPLYPKSIKVKSLLNILLCIIMANFSYLALFNNGKIAREEIVFQKLGVHNIIASFMVKIGILIEPVTFESSFVFLILFYFGQL